MATAKGLTADLLAARSEGLSYAAIGKRFGITKQSAWERIDRAEKAARHVVPEVVDIPAFLRPRPAPVAVTPALPDGYTPAEGDMHLVIERPATVEVKPRPTPALNAPYVAEVYNRHGLDEVRRRWPEASDDALDEAIRVGKRMVAPPADDLPKGWSTRLAGAIARLFGGRR